MRGTELIAALRKEFKLPTDAKLAAAVGLTPGRIAQIKKAQAITPEYIGKFIFKMSSAHASAALQGAIRSIVEFFPISRDNARPSGKRLPFNSKSEHGRALRKALEGSSQREVRGIYSFYNSQGEIIYLGKTEKKNLFFEMVEAYNRNMADCKIYRVRHPFGRYRPKKGGSVRQIQRENVYLYHIADYFSAYQVSDELVSAVEALLIRFVPNDIINARIERKALEVFSPLTI